MTSRFDAIAPSARRDAPTDWPFAVLLLLCSIGGASFGVYVLARADWQRLFYGMDWRGQLCDSAPSPGHWNGSGNVSNSTRGVPRVQYWPNPAYRRELGSVCLAECPSAETDVVCVCNPQLVVGLDAMRQSLLGTAFDATALFSSELSSVAAFCAGGAPFFALAASDAQLLSTSEDAARFAATRGASGHLRFGGGGPLSYTPAMLPRPPGSYYQILSNGTVKRLAPLCNPTYRSFEAAGRCLPVDSLSVLSGTWAHGAGGWGPSAHAQDWVDDGWDVAARTFHDLRASWYVLPAAYIGTTFLCAMYIWLMRHCARCTVYGVLLGLHAGLCALAAGAAYSAHAHGFQLHGYAAATRSYSSYGYFGVAVVAAILEILAVIFTVGICGRIEAACRVMQSAGKMLGQFHAVALLPFLHIGPLMLISAFGLAVLLGLLASCEDGAVPLYGTHRRECSTELLFAVGGWLLGCIWALGVVVGGSGVAVSYCACAWFLLDKKGRKLLRSDRMRSACLVGESLRATYGTHVGTLALSTLIMMLLSTFLLVVRPLDYVQRRYEARGAPIPCWLSFVLRCVCCCAWCFRTCLRHMGRDVYIHSILFHLGFCGALRQTAALVVTNGEQLIVTKSLASVVTIASRLAITSTMTGAAWGVLGMAGARDRLITSVFIFLTCLRLSGMVTSLYHAIVDAALVCFLRMGNEGAPPGDAPV